MHFHEVLGTNPDTSDAQLKHCYREMMSGYHPDKVNHLGAELKELALVKSKQITEAYTAIRTRRGI